MASAASVKGLASTIANGGCHGGEINYSLLRALWPRSIVWALSHHKYIGWIFLLSEEKYYNHPTFLFLIGQKVKFRKEDDKEIGSGEVDC